MWRLIPALLETNWWRQRNLNGQDEWTSLTKPWRRSANVWNWKSFPITPYRSSRVRTRMYIAKNSGTHKLHIPKGNSSKWASKTRQDKLLLSLNMSVFCLRVAHVKYIDCAWIPCRKRSGWRSFPAIDRPTDKDLGEGNWAPNEVVEEKGQFKSSRTSGERPVSNNRNDIYPVGIHRLW